MRAIRRQNRNALEAERGRLSDKEKANRQRREGTPAAEEIETWQQGRFSSSVESVAALALFIEMFTKFMEN